MKIATHEQYIRGMAATYPHTDNAYNWALNRIATLEAALAEAREDSARLLTTGQAVLDRWDSPKWKDQDPTAKVINELRAAIDAARKEKP